MKKLETIKRAVLGMDCDSLITLLNDSDVRYRIESAVYYGQQITGSPSAAEALKQTPWYTDQWEQFKVLLLNNSNKLLNIETIGDGGASAVQADPRRIFRLALSQRGCTGIILAHNHPSGAKTPSQTDLRITNRLVKAGEAIDIRVLDHIILTPEGNYYSFVDNGDLEV